MKTVAFTEGKRLDEIEQARELIVVGDLPTSEDNITDYFIKLREGTQHETP